MSDILPTREQALALLHEYTQKPGLLQHAACVEIAMRAYAKKLSEDEDLFGHTGLLHDFDYEAYPDPKEHTVKGGEILKAAGYPEEMIRAIWSHNPLNELNVARESLLAKTLFACDELCGFIVAVALVRPSKSLMDLKAKSVTKKFKEKAFAAAVDRDEMREGAAEIGVEVNEHVAFVIHALKAEKTVVGLPGDV